ncbi:hypothetical protein ES703_89289 [subsurface metagenome]
MLHLHYGEERLLRDFHPPELLHPFLARSLSLEQLPLASDIPAVALSSDILAQRLYRRPGNHPAPDCRLDDHFELLAVDHFLELFAQGPALGVRMVLMDNAAQGVYHFASKENVQLFQIARPVTDELVVVGSVPPAYRFQPVEEVVDYFG